MNVSLIPVTTINDILNLELRDMDDDDDAVVNDDDDDTTPQR